MKNTNNKEKITGAILSAIIFELLFLTMFGMTIYFQFTEEEKIPWLLFIIQISIYLIPSIAIIINLITRIKEIKGGEEDEASKY